MRRRGRPRICEDLSSVYLYARVTPAQLGAVRREAEKRGMTLADYVRTLVLSEMGWKKAS